MSRRNSERMGSHATPTAPAPQSQFADFSFVVPTKFVSLPSEGKYYPEGHPLHNKDVIEIKHMTAKEEDILTSKALLSKGIAVDRVLQNVIVDPAISLDTLLAGDKNAITIALRAVSYGADYETKVDCPSCSTSVTYSFDLDNPIVNHGEALEIYDIKYNGNGTFDVVLPITNITTTFRLLTSKDESNIVKKILKSNNGVENNITEQLSTMVVAFNGETDQNTIRYVIDKLPSMDSIRIRTAYRFVNPTVELNQKFECSNCGYEAEMEVPLTADFFWPQR